MLSIEPNDVDQDTLRSLLSVQYVKQFRHPILRLYCTLNRVLYKILETVHLIETYLFTVHSSLETYICEENYTK